MPRIAKLTTFIFTIVFLLPQTILLGQHSPKKDFILSAETHAGFIIAHRNNLTNVIKGHVFGVELNYVFQTNGCKTWHKEYKFPEVGFCLVHMDLGNPEQLGNMEAIYPYANIRLNKLSNRVALNLRLATGVAYITKPFDRLTNHQNKAIGSHVNAFVNIRFSTTTMLSSAWRLNAGFGLSHASNGAYSSPNLGLNIASINLGLGYHFGNQTCTYIVDTSSLKVKKWQTSIIAVAGIKELETPGGDKHLAYSIQTNVLRGLNYKNSLGAGLEVFYNNATIARWAKDSVEDPSFGDIVQAGAKLSYAYNFHRLAFPIEFGVYIYKKQKTNGVFFHRIGFRYMITDHLVGNFTLLTHFAKADYFEWGLGYRF